MHQQECGICLQILEEPVIQLECGHVYHRQCIRRSLRVKLQNKCTADARGDEYNVGCPTCKRPCLQIAHVLKDEESEDHEVRAGSLCIESAASSGDNKGKKKHVDANSPKTRPTGKPSNRKTLQQEGPSNRKAVEQKIDMQDKRQQLQDASRDDARIEKGKRLCKVYAAKAEMEERAKSVKRKALLPKKTKPMKKKFGTKVEVWQGTAERTRRGLTKKDLSRGKTGKIVSKLQQQNGHKLLEKYGKAWKLAAVKALAVNRLPISDYIRKGTPEYRQAMQLMSTSCN